MSVRIKVQFSGHHTPEYCDPYKMLFAESLVHYEACCDLGCNAMPCTSSLPLFQRNTLLPSAEANRKLSSTSFLLGVLVSP
jgi:hypothetical protein